MNKKKSLVLLLALSLVISMIPLQASAAVKSAGTPAEVQSLTSSENLEHNFVNVTANGTSLYVEAETPIIPAFTRQMPATIIALNSVCRTMYREQAEHSAVTMC